jgi:DNA polymerase-3 subunit epsilon
MARAPRVPRVAVGHPGPIVGIDVETASSTHGAVCALGVAIVWRGQVAHERHWYLDPGVRFDPRFIGIHGITPERVRGEPRLADVWAHVISFIDDAVAETREPTLFAGASAGDAGDPPPLYVAHNAPFDRMQIERALDAPLPFRVACTVAMSRRAFPRLERHNLATVSAHLRIPLRHHDALSDARACALIAARCIAAGSGA